MPRELRRRLFRRGRPPKRQGASRQTCLLAGRGARANRRRAAAGGRTVFSLLDLGACCGGLPPLLAPGFSTVECGGGEDGRDVLCRQSSCSFPTFLDDKCSSCFKGEPKKSSPCDISLDVDGRRSIMMGLRMHGLTSLNQTRIPIDRLSSQYCNRCRTLACGF